jgi:transcriptional regulator with AAA-type ATPase domain
MQIGDGLSPEAGMREEKTLIERFAYQDRHAYDRWRKEKLSLLTVPSSPETLARLHGIYAFHSSLLQNIVEFTPGNFQISVLTQSFAPSRPDALSRLPAARAAGVRQQCLAFLDAARKWNMDFVDFSRFQVLPTGSLRFAWTLERQELPTQTSFIRLLGDGRHLRKASPAWGQTPPYLCRREDFAANLLRSRSSRGLSSGANVRVRIHTKSPWQKTVARDILFHNLNDAETLLLAIDLEDMPLGDRLAALSGRKKARRGSLAEQAQEFRLFLKQSVFQETILLIDNLERREDDRLLRFLLESGDISGLTAVLLGDSTSCECDLEFNEDPQNLMAGHLPASTGGRKPSELDGRERKLLERIAAIGVPVPAAIARLLAAQGDDAAMRTPAPPGDACVASLLKKRCLMESRDRQGLVVDPEGVTLSPGRGRDADLAWLAGHSDWPYARIAYAVAGRRWAALENDLKKWSRESPGQVAPGPAADLLCRHLPQFPPGSKALEYAVDILILGNCLAQAAQVLAGAAAPAGPCLRLKKAHLAMRRKDYLELGKLLAGTDHPPEECRDEWLFLNLIHCEKDSQKGKADAFARKIKSPYFRSLALVQLSDRSIYNRDFAKARAQLAEALDHFIAGKRYREEIEARSQMAKLLREEGDFKQSESLYKILFVQSEAEGLALSSAGAAVDLGNLYAENDDDFQAECWYQKAKRIYARERNHDGLMLVNANLVNVLLAKGDWLQADRLLRDLLAWNEEKKLLESSAIDLLNWAGLEALRLHEEKALRLIDRAETIFRASANSKGLSECAFLRGRLSGFEATLPPGCGHWTSEDQKTVGRLFRLADPGSAGREADMFRLLAAIRSRKTRFEALRLLLKKYRRREWLGRFQELALELSPREKNYFYFEYLYMSFDLAPEGPPAARHDDFIAMVDFFTVNKRALSPRLIRLRQQCEESEKDLGLFAAARLVEQYRKWRLPADFFSSFFHEIGKAAPVDWLVMAVHEKQRQLFRFAGSDQFHELGEEMLQDALATPLDQNLDLAEVKRRYRSPERLFYPFANTKIIRWPLAEDLLACLAIGFRDGALYFQDFCERQRETLNKFSLLFRNFLETEYRIDEKLDFIVGTSQKIKELKRRIAQVSKVDFSLLISGESGSGKELVARAVHLLGPRAGQPFIPVNAAAIPDTLLEAELFGSRKGAFSGASDHRVGLLEAADRGTLFLDEIADLPLALQAKLLRALQEREIRRLGENKTIRIDVRLISASNKDLGELIRKNLFREDLFYRLQDLVIAIPPLRERREDIPLLIDHFLRKFGYPVQDPSRLGAIADRFRDDAFPGNVRELESRVKSMITFNPELELADEPGQKLCSWKSARQEHERELLLKTLKEMNGHRSRTAEKLGISRMALFNLLKKHCIEP